MRILVRIIKSCFFADKYFMMQACKKLSFKNSSGFTLVELAVVTMVLGLLSSIAFINYNKIITTSRLKQGSHEIEKMLIYAKHLAANTGRTIYAYCDKKTNFCNIYEGLGIGALKKNSLSIKQTAPAAVIKIWCVKNLSIRDASSIVFQDLNAYGNCPEAVLPIKPKSVKYSFMGSGKHLTLSYTLYNITKPTDIEIKFNKFVVRQANVTNVNRWGNTENIILPQGSKSSRSIVNPVDKKLYRLDFANNPQLFGKVSFIKNKGIGMKKEIVFYPGGRLAAGGTIALTYGGIVSEITIRSGPGLISIKQRAQ